MKLPLEHQMFNTTFHVCSSRACERSGAEWSGVERSRISAPCSQSCLFPPLQATSLRFQPAALKSLIVRSKQIKKSAVYFYFSWNCTLVSENTFPGRNYLFKVKLRCILGWACFEVSSTGVKLERNGAGDIQNSPAPRSLMFHSQVLLRTCKHTVMCKIGQVNNKL